MHAPIHSTKHMSFVFLQLLFVPVPMQLSADYVKPWIWTGRKGQRIRNYTWTISWMRVTRAVLNGPRKSGCLDSDKVQADKMQ